MLDIVILDELNSYSSINDNLNNINKLLQKNIEICKKINDEKNKITYYYNNKLWDKYKKISNEYELIFTTPNTGNNISIYTPVSRSFFKLWEMLYDYEDEIFFNTNNIKCLFLAEGPGGFAEALIKYRYDGNNLNDSYYGISLKSNNDKNIPEWKLGKDLLKKMQIMYGEDDTGNLYNYGNIADLCTKLNKNSLDIITADGGFDFSSDFNNQEDLSFHLILCEVVAALLLQKKGGSFILKIFDIFSEYTIKIIHILKKFYKKIYIKKPLTSRPANSEKYLVCLDFNLSHNDLLLRLINVIKNYNDDNVLNFFNTIDYDINLLNTIVQYNDDYAKRQILYIKRTINYIIDHEKTEKNMHDIINFHIKESIKWCKKYKIPCI